MNVGFLHVGTGPGDTFETHLSNSHCS